MVVQANELGETEPLLVAAERSDVDMHVPRKLAKRRWNIHVVGDERAFASIHENKESSCETVQKKRNFEFFF